MAAPRSATYTAPSSSPLAGQTFEGQAGTTTAYNRYLQANAKALGFSNYSQQKAERIAARHIFVAEKKAERFGPRGVLTPQARMTINQIIAKYVGEDMTDRSIGGPLDRYLRELGRRTGQETWPVGETNGRAVQAVA